MNDHKGSGLICGTDDSLTEVDFDVNGPNTTEISILRESGNDNENLNFCIPPEVILPEMGDAITANDEVCRWAKHSEDFCSERFSIYGR